MPATDSTTPMAGPMVLMVLMFLVILMTEALWASQKRVKMKTKQVEMQQGLTLQQ